MNQLLKEFLSYILTKNEVSERVLPTRAGRAAADAKKIKGKKNKPSKRAAHQPGDVWQTLDRSGNPTGKWSAKRSDGTAEGGFENREKAIAWRDGRGKAPGEEKPKSGKKEPSTLPTGGVKKPAQSPEQTASIIASLSGKSRELDALINALKTGNKSKIQAAIDKYGITRSKSGKLILNINGRRVDLFSDKKAKVVGDALEKELNKYGISLRGAESSADTTVSAFSPSTFIPTVPKGETPIRTSFSERAKTNEDDSITVTYLNSDGSTKEVTYESIPDTAAWVDEKFARWESSKEGKGASEEQKNEIKRTLTLAAFCIQRRHSLLSGLLEKSEDVAMYDTSERKEALVSSVEKRLVDVCTDKGRKSRIQSKFTAYRNAETPEEAEAELVEIIKELDEERISNKNSPLRASGGIPAIAESFTALIEIKMGRNVIIPLRENYTASDVLSLSDMETRGMTARQLEESIKSIYVGVSVKLKKGGASSMIAKTEQSVFRDPPGSTGGETRNTLRVLANSTDIFQGGRPPRTPKQIKEHRAKAKEAIASRVDEINAHYNINPPIKNVDKLIEFLGNGEPECIAGKVSSRRKPPPPIGPGTRGPNPSKAGYDPKGRKVDVEAWKLNFAMQLSWTAIYNTNVTGQAFASHSWTETGVKKADGITTFAKQEAQSLKQPRKGSEGQTYQPDQLVSYNAPQTSVDDVRSGNPCK